MPYHFEDFALDGDRRELRRGNELVSVEPQVFDLLQYLIRNRERVVSKDDLVDAVWQGRIISDATLASRINAARNALGDSGDEQRLIRTILRRGFRFVGTVREEVQISEAGAIAAMEQSKPGSRIPARPSIAVLPFVNLSGDPDQDYFADGMVEDIITGLSRIRWLFVIARNSSFTYKGRAVDVKQVGRELGVRYVLEGSVRKVGGRVRIAGQLIDAEDGSHLWAERYDRDLTDVFALQDEITVSVVAAIEPNLRRAEIERVRRRRPDSLDAYDLLLRALSDVYTFMPQGASKGLPLLDQALAIEPTYALAHGFAAWAHQTLFIRGGMQAEHREKAARHAHAAIEYGSGDAMALALAGFTIGLVEHDRRLADEAFAAALALSASCAFVYAFGCVPVAYGGDAARAINWGEQAMRLSPLDTMSCVPQGIIGFGNFLSGRHELAVIAGRRAVELNPGFSILHGWLAAPLARLGQLDEAKASAGRLLSLDPHFTIGRWSAAVGIAPDILDDVTDAMRMAGLPA
ncbi:MAG: transcriptional regulator [Mesorhizobium sp.]|uniref:winged helix-turn-helix domain-containing tetratricopeptide repeat protein n=1 Tax=Mesorhizobium sp. TaxID=1871066 RepID=UPI000FE8FCF0|nr:winged helix-turn-helix domain-containing protein [Mesorhizobium sp.]RWH78854.1 MAG: transcriptional regulator [Mesorhizobium sp.]RWH81474.1 MAG: transcriptional regulator [Mesorhizobium sp.]RWH90292.1 MAG: transcriptional regulator [Mesorhizobium sp.]RWH97813.1 MAG: transcriptional regulator [Mesorhizobium sp.]RWI00315.1 MAG: transcriptional regulator [Mesorhizobium sp.]